MHLSRQLKQTKANSQNRQKNTGAVYFPQHPSYTGARQVN